MNRHKFDTAQQLYLRFLKLAQSLSQLPGVTALAPPEAHLLQEVVLRDFEHRAFTVSEALAMKHLGSPATLHKRLLRLHAAGLLDYKKDAKDHRTKYLIATPLAMQHYARIGEVMQLLMQAE